MQVSFKIANDFSHSCRSSSRTPKSISREFAIVVFVAMGVLVALDSLAYFEFSVDVDWIDVTVSMLAAVTLTVLCLRAK